MKIMELKDPNLDLALGALMNEKIDVKTAFLIAEIMQERAKHLNAHEAVRKSLLMKHSKKDEKGEMKVAPDGQRYELETPEEFAAAYNDLLILEVDIKKIPRASLEALNISLTPAQVLALNPLIS